jgi:hypothetical protein
VEVKRLSIIIFFVLLCLKTINAQNQDFRIEQHQIANTADTISYLTLIEKEAIKYLNLARLYPTQFVNLVLENYKGPEGYATIEKDNEYFKSLKKKLLQIKAMPALEFEKDLYENAKCFAVETGKKGGEGHERKLCLKKNYAECISYGMFSGKDIALQWLIDDGVPNFGHREIVLNANYHKIGLSVHKHKKWKTCAVAEIIW